MSSRMDLLWISIVICLLFRFVTAASYNPLITNGTCYYKAGEEMAEEYSPCGNAALSHYWCCQLGDACASENACYNFGTGTTYLAGCTDPKFQDDSCPYKGLYVDQQWTGLVRCFVHQDTEDPNAVDEPWATCEDDEQPLVEDSDLARSCACNNSDPNYTTAVVFTAKMGLDNYATLPAKKGASIKWAAGMSPSIFEFTNSPTTSTTSSTSQTTITWATSRASSIASSNPSSSSTSMTTSPSSISISSTFSTSSPIQTLTQTVNAAPAGLSTGAKVGVGLGTSLGILFVVCSAVLLSWLLRRRKQKQYQWDSGQGSQKGNKNGVSEPETCSPAWSGHKSELPNDEFRPELPGDQKHQPSPNSPNPSTLIASPTTTHTQDGHSSIHARDGSYSSQSPSAVSVSDGQAQNHQYQPYRPSKQHASNHLDGIAEMPDNEKPRSAHGGHGTQGPVYSVSGEHERYNLRRQGAGVVEGLDKQYGSQVEQGGRLGRDAVHELPG